MDDVTYLIFPMALSGFWVLALMGIALVYGNSERVVKYQGQTLLEVDKGFLDPWYSCYAYCGIWPGRRRYSWVRWRCILEG